MGRSSTDAGVDIAKLVEGAKIVAPVSTRKLQYSTAMAIPLVWGSLDYSISALLMLFNASRRLLQVVSLRRAYGSDGRRHSRMGGGAVCIVQFQPRCVLANSSRLTLPARRFSPISN